MTRADFGWEDRGSSRARAAPGAADWFEVVQGLRHDGRRPGRPLRLRLLSSFNVIFKMYTHIIASNRISNSEMLLRTDETVDAQRVHLVAKLSDGFLLVLPWEVQILFRAVNFADAVQLSMSHT